MKSSKDWNWKFADKDSASLAETVFAAEFSITFGRSTETYLFHLHIRDLSHDKNAGIVSPYTASYWEPHDMNEIRISTVDLAKTQSDVFVEIDRCVARILEGLAEEMRGAL